MQNTFHVVKSPRTILINAIIALGIFTFLPLNDVAANDDAFIQENTKRLQELEAELDQQNETLSEQRKKAKILEAKVQCNWTLLKDYDECEYSYEKKSEDYIACVNTAKNKSKQCFSALSSE